jgi:succinate dehydrogenase / fumarate reductase cytochrome b subunit
MAIWLFAAKWGITPGETARKRFGYACAAFGVVIAVMGLASIWAFVRDRNTGTLRKTCRLR